MICPNCNETLRERERAGVEVDVCPACRGIWLDRGELDKIIERESRWDDDDDDWGGTRPSNGGSARRDRGGRGYDRQQPQKKKGFFQTLVENFTEGGEGGMD